VSSIVYAVAGVNFKITCMLTPPVAGATVEIDLFREGAFEQSFSGVTDSLGVVTFNYKKAPSGTYATIVTDVIANGYVWDGETPPNSHNK
jgi:hypothetical protein